MFKDTIELRYHKMATQITKGQEYCGAPCKIYKVSYRVYSQANKLNVKIMDDTLLSASRVTEYITERHTEIPYIVQMNDAYDNPYDYFEGEHRRIYKNTDNQCRLLHKTLNTRKV